LAKSNHPDINDINLTFANPYKELDKSFIFNASRFQQRAIIKNYPKKAGHFVDHPDHILRRDVARLYPEHAKNLLNDPIHAVRVAARKSSNDRSW
jgi:hypothetical protein